MKTKYFIHYFKDGKDISAELEFEDCTAVKDSEYIRHEIEAQYSLLNKVNKKEHELVYTTELKPLPKEFENVRSLSELDKEFEEYKGLLLALIDKIVELDDNIPELGETDENNRVRYKDFSDYVANLNKEIEAKKERLKSE